MKEESIRSTEKNTQAESEGITTIKNRRKLLMNDNDCHTRKDQNAKSEQQQRIVSSTPNTSHLSKEGVDSIHSNLSLCPSNMEILSDNDALQFFLRLRDVIMTQRQMLKKYKSKYRAKKNQLQNLKISIQPENRHLTEERKSIVKDSTHSTFNDESGPISSKNRMESEFASLQYEELKVEAVMTLYELESIKSERRELKRMLQDRDHTMESISNKLQSCEEELATLELERELSNVENSYLNHTSQSIQCNLEYQRPKQPPRLFKNSLLCLRHQFCASSNERCGRKTEWAAVASDASPSTSGTVVSHGDNKTEIT